MTYWRHDCPWMSPWKQLDSNILQQCPSEAEETRDLVVQDWSLGFKRARRQPRNNQVAQTHSTPAARESTSFPLSASVAIPHRDAFPHAFLNTHRTLPSCTTNEHADPDNGGQHGPAAGR